MRNNQPQSRSYRRQFQQTDKYFKKPPERNQPDPYPRHSQYEGSRTRQADYHGRNLRSDHQQPQPTSRAARPSRYYRGEEEMDDYRYAYEEDERNLAYSRPQFKRNPSQNPSGDGFFKKYGGEYFSKFSEQGRQASDRGQSPMQDERHSDHSHLSRQPSQHESQARFQDFRGGPPNSSGGFQQPAYKRHGSTQQQQFPEDDFSKKYGSSSEHPAQRDQSMSQSRPRQAPRYDQVQGKQTYELIVKNVNFDSTANDVVNSFRHCGPISHWNFPRKDPNQRNYGKHKGFGYIYFSTKEAHKKALQMKEDPPVFNGRAVFITTKYYYDDKASSRPHSSYRGSVTPPRDSKSPAGESGRQGKDLALMLQKINSENKSSTTNDLRLKFDSTNFKEALPGTQIKLKDFRSPSRELKKTNSHLDALLEDTPEKSPEEKKVSSPEERTPALGPPEEKEEEKTDPKLDKELVEVEPARSEAKPESKSNHPKPQLTLSPRSRQSLGNLGSTPFLPIDHIKEEINEADFEIKFMTDSSEGYLSDFDYEAAEARTKKFSDFLPESESSDEPPQKKKQDVRVMATRRSTKMLGPHSLRSSQAKSSGGPKTRCNAKTPLEVPTKTIKKPSPPLKKPPKSVEDSKRKPKPGLKAQEKKPLAMKTRASSTRKLPSRRK